MILPDGREDIVKNINTLPKGAALKGDPRYRRINKTRRGSVQSALAAMQSAGQKRPGQCHRITHNQHNKNTYP